MPKIIPGGQESHVNFETPEVKPVWTNQQPAGTSSPCSRLDNAHRLAYHWETARFLGVHKVATT